MIDIDWDYVPKKLDFVFGGYDAKSCTEKIRKTYDPAYKDIELDADTPGDAGRMEAGIVREQEVIDLWVEELDPARVFVIAACDRSAASKRARGQKTLELMRDPGSVEVIINGRLPQLWSTHRTGEPDALVREGQKEDGTWIWLPIDMKDHKSLQGTRKATPWDVSTLTEPTYDKRSPVTFADGIPQKVDALQLAHYHRMLETLGHAAEHARGAIIGREGFLVWHDLEEKLYPYINSEGKRTPQSAMEYYDQAFAERLKIASSAKIGIALVGPEWKSDCAGCPFRTTCHDELKMDLDHITLLPGVTPERAKPHYANGVKTVAALSRLHVPTARLIDANINLVELFTKAGEAASEDPILTLIAKPTEAQTLALKEAGIFTVADLALVDRRTAKYSGRKTWNLAQTIDQARVTKVSKVHRRRGVNFVQVPRTRIEEDIDIEDAPNPNGEGTLVYMIGVRDAGYSIRDGENIQTRTEYHCFVDYSGTEEGEAKVFADFWAHITHMRNYAKARKYGYTAFHYTKHEDVAFKSLAKKHEGKDGIPPLSEVEAFLDSKHWVDLYQIVSSQLIWPTESVTLKDTAKWVRFAWRDSDPGGGNSIVWYQNAVNHPDPAVREENRRRLAEYNADDCHAQLEIREWLSRLGDTRQPGRRLPSVGTLDKRFYRRKPTNA